MMSTLVFCTCSQIARVGFGVQACPTPEVYGYALSAKLARSSCKLLLCLVKPLRYAGKQQEAQHPHSKLEMTYS